MRTESKNSPGYTKTKHIIIHVLVTLFGISAWIGINGIFVQLPVLINISPEGWNLPAYVVLIVQSANVGPLLYTLLQHFQYKLNESSWILCVLTLGTFAIGLLIFYYSERTVIGGVEHSLTLFILIFFNALIGCFSSVLFMPYLRNFHEVYLVSYFIGEGLSGVLPSIVALIQGIDDNLNCSTKTHTMNMLNFGIKFSPRDYFLFIFIILFLSLTAFIILHYSSFTRNKKNFHESRNVISNKLHTNHNFQDDIGTTHDHYHNMERPLSERNDENDDTSIQNDSEHLSKQLKIYLYLLLGICCFFSNGFFPSIQSYSCLPYGNIAYILSITFSQFANPIACFLALWFMTSNIKVINYFSIICLAIGSYVTYLALMSPNPPLQKTKIGIILVVSSWTVLIGFISYLKLVIVSVFRSVTAPRILFNAGAMMQIGSASGAVLSFLLINFTDYFKVYDRCTAESN